MSEGTRTLNIVACREVHRGQGANGEFVIYEVEATKEDGTAIDLPLRAFAQLPDGVGEYVVSPYTNKRGERTFTLSKPRAGGNPGARLGPKVDELRERVDRLEAQVRELMRARDARFAQEQARPSPPATF